MLTGKTSNKTLVECANDHLWANGVPLYSDSCLDRQRWISQGLLGKLLEEVRSELTGAITTEKQPQVSMNIDTVTVSTTPTPVLAKNTKLLIRLVSPSLQSSQWHRNVKSRAQTLHNRDKIYGNVPNHLPSPMHKHF